MSEEYTNELEIRFLTLRRTGSHGIINWVANHIPGIRYALMAASARGRDPFYYNGCFHCQTMKKPNCPFLPIPSKKRSSILKVPLEPEIEDIRRRKKNVLMLVYDHFNVSSLQKMEIPTDREKVLGKSRRRVDIYILRDFFNWSASMLRHQKSTRAAMSDPRTFFYHNFKYYPGWEKDAKDIYMQAYLRLLNSMLTYQKMAEVFVDSQDSPDTLFLRFNQWVADKQYRKSIIEWLGFEFTDEGINNMSLAGRGSSFDGPEYVDKAKEMDVLGRWKFFKDNKLYWTLLEEQQRNIALSNEIFGKIPGTEEYVSVLPLFD